MSQSTRSYPDWKAPAQDGHVLIWPDPPELLQQTIQNQHQLRSADQVRIQNSPLPELRRELRRFLGQVEDTPMLASGHQAELYHPGVWVKDVLIGQAAAKLGGLAWHFAVDTDHPKHLNLSWPGGSMPLTDDPASATAGWVGLLHPPTPAHIQSIEATARAAWTRFDFEPLLFEFLQSLRRLALEATELPSMLTNAQHQLDWSLGLRHHALTVSPILSSWMYLAFVHHIMARPEVFARQYNASLAEYRKAAGMRSTTRPMPDLFINDDAVEVPFWLDDLQQGSRSRPSIFRAGDAWVLQLVGGEEFVFMPDLGAQDAAESLRNFLIKSNHRIAPRALTLTLFLRLLVVDQFVHGIGGGRYDQITDRLMATHFHIDPPHFCVTTATLFFPGAVDQPRVCLPCVISEGHRLEHQVLGPAKRELVERINALPKHSTERERVFLEMHRQRRAAVGASAALKAWEARFERAQIQAKHEQVLFDRELFYAVQSRARLLELIDRYTTAFS